MKYFLDTEFHERKTYSKFLGMSFGKPMDTIELISIGIVAEDGRNYYAICNEFDAAAAWHNEWLRENVLRQIFNELFQKYPPYIKSWYDAPFTLKELKRLLKTFGQTKTWIRDEIIEFCSTQPTPEFYAYYADYDWIVFCRLFGRMVDLPKGFPMYCRDLKQMLDEKSEKSGVSLEKIKAMEDYPKQESEHNALADALWNTRLFDFLNGSQVNVAKLA